MQQVIYKPSKTEKIVSYRKQIARQRLSQKWEPGGPPLEMGAGADPLEIRPPQAYVTLPNVVVLV